MRYSIDVVFIDGSGKVISVIKDILPWRFTPYIREVRSVIEFRSGLLKNKMLNVGDKEIWANKRKMSISESELYTWDLVHTLL